MQSLSVRMYVMEWMVLPYAILECMYVCDGVDGVTLCNP